jgi:hypothetical protein
MFLLALGLAILAGTASPASAHGGVKLEQDECVLKIGPNTMHFIGYQRTGEEQEFCEDIAHTGPTVIALTAVSPDLRDMAIGVRIVKDVGEEQEKANLEAATEFYLPPKVYRNGTMTFEHDFKKAGHYVGIVTVSDDQGNQWMSRFPFTVGIYTFMGMIEYILYAVGITSLSAYLWYMYWRRQQLKTANADAIARA